MSIRHLNRHALLHGITCCLVALVLSCALDGCATSSESHLNESTDAHTTETQASSNNETPASSSDSSDSTDSNAASSLPAQDAPAHTTPADGTTTGTTPSDNASDTGASASKTTPITLADIPAYSGKPAAAIHDNIPFFGTDELFVRSMETYSPLDELGRCGVAYACIGLETMPTEDRGRVGEVRPTGWHTITYDSVDGRYLYNRCHLIGFQLAAENANPRNLITGTRFMNVEGMLPYENRIASYVERTAAHVLYRVTPLFDGQNLVAHGVLMEARSIEDGGAGICFNVFVYNVQPGVGIDYATGNSWSEKTNTPAPAPSDEASYTYILNTNSKKFHYPECSSVDRMSESNKQETYDTRSNIIAQGYEPCGRCNP